MQILLKIGTTLMSYKEGQVLLQIGVALLYYNLGQVVLQCRAGITKFGNFYYKFEAGITKRGNFYCKMAQVLQSGATFITTQGRYYKVGELLQIRSVQCSFRFPIARLFRLFYNILPIKTNFLLDRKRVVGEISTEKKWQNFTFQMGKTNQSIEISPAQKLYASLLQKKLARKWRTALSKTDCAKATFEFSIFFQSNSERILSTCQMI